MYVPSSSNRVRPVDARRPKQENSNALSSFFQLPKLLSGKSKNTVAVSTPIQVAVYKPKATEQYFANPQRAKSNRSLVTPSLGSNARVVENPAIMIATSDPYVSRVNGRFIPTILPSEPALSGAAVNSIVKPRKLGTEGTASTDNSSSTASTSSSGFASKLFEKIPAVGKTERLESSPEESTPHEPASTVAKPSEANTTLPTITKAPCCDKCDGKHETDSCPYYKKKREDHPDAQRRKPIGGTSSLPGSYITSARVARQPGDGSCLFHSISYGLNRSGSSSSQSAASLRQVVTQYIRNNPTTLICDTPIQDWVKWDSGTSVSDYSRKIASGAWGGGIEMACLSLILSCNIHVYERQGGGYRRISTFDCATNAESKPIVRVLYCGGVHYDALVT